MIPFLWVGYWLRRVSSNRYMYIIVVLCCIICLALIPEWNYRATIYISPFDILSLNYNMIITYLFRFAIGSAMSIIIIFVIKLFENSFIKRLAPYGRYSLTIYTASLAILGPIANILSKFNLHINTVILIDFSSLALSLLMIISIIWFCQYCNKSTRLKMIFLGE